MDVPASQPWAVVRRGVGALWQAVGGKLIEQMTLPLGILTTDLSTGQGVLFRRGDTAQAVRAFSAVPGVFNPVPVSGREYVGGGLVASVPVRQAREIGAKVVLAVDISADPQDIPSGGLLSLLPKTTVIMGQSINRLELAGANVVLRPALAGVDSTDFASRQQQHRSRSGGDVGGLAPPQGRSVART